MLRGGGQSAVDGEEVRDVGGRGSFGLSVVDDDGLVGSLDLRVGVRSGVFAEDGVDVVGHCTPVIMVEWLVVSSGFCNSLCPTAIVIGFPPTFLSRN